jgi:cytochrome c5
MSKTVLLLILTAALISFAVLTDVHGQKAAQPNLPNGPGKEILQNACTECHDLQMVYNTGYDKQEWQLTVERMITAGANVTPDQAPVLVDYLLKNGRRPQAGQDHTRACIGLI